MTISDLIKPGKILIHKTLGEGFVSKVRYETDCVIMLIDFNDGMGRRNIMVSDLTEFNKYFELEANV